MIVLYKKHQLSAEQQRALELLSDAGEHGCTGATFVAYGFKVDILAELVGGELAVVQRQPQEAGERSIEAARVMITDSGRKAIEG